MAKIYSAPKVLEIPTIDFSNYNVEEQEKKENEYIEKLSFLLKRRKSEKHVGEVLNFPHADGYAMYMVAGIKPVELVHLELGDAWHLPHIERLTAKDITLKIEQQQALEKLFNK